MTDLDMAQAGQTMREVVERALAAGSAAAVFSAPVQNGDYTVITAAAVGAGGGFGFGQGTGPAGLAQDSTAMGGGGGVGGGSKGRPIAAIVIGPDGVEVRPIVDVKVVAVTAVLVCCCLALLLSRRKRGAS